MPNGPPCPFATPNQEHHSAVTNRPKCTKKPPTRYGFYDIFSYALISSSEDPYIFREAVSSPEKDKWIESMMEGDCVLHKN